MGAAQLRSEHVIDKGTDVSGEIEVGEAVAPRAAPAVRRRDRVVTDEAWMSALLESVPLGVLAVSAEGEPFVNGNLFAYDAARRAIYLHTARVGNTRELMDQPQHVCFMAMEMGRLLPADTALEFSVEFASVVVYGRGVVVDDPAEAEQALQLLLNKYAPHLRPGRDYAPISAPELKRTAVYRVAVEAWTGKRKQVPADFPGAFMYAPPWSGIATSPTSD